MFKKKRYVLVCTNERAPDHPKGSCSACGAVEVHDRMKALLEEKNLKGKARILSTSCLDTCEHGAALCVMPDNVWYGGVRAEDVEEIIERHLEGGEIVERLLIPEAPQGLSLL
ncbi:MAG: (2Fe-2S) ferredoxin domain-containing protein [bacterium]|nr:(2Fe-2S) ferredoxin domain-containing protein [bacterium]